ncbi:UDP-N-acetylmuramate--L-alanine ligase [Mucilaginibacter sp. KACC 22063]|uniref:UDP-N-acetylmuramate--L-alanine ligase n=1 Tax=Mucilaginibacter sp. KACC 22063 TaxID=3025666 RepID=UPI00236512CF|nr:Mur ligase family protein [Mucilaginibacter sp. KACC 22063]WDF56976.1 Mur ligase family protein [Mucilaginibacter sp. KACC 22063]
MKIHFIAIGGSAMHNLAIALHKKGFTVTGSDDIIFEPSVSRLKKHGLLPEQYGWFPEKITKDLNAVILGMHARTDNPELLMAQRLGVKVYSYPEYIYEQSKDKLRVVIGGSHGKTTITSMILHVLQHAGMAFDYLVGAQLEGFDTMVSITDAPLIVIEGDEYLASPIDRRPKFHLYKANIAVISGIAWDHINVFPTFANYVEQFQKFIETITVGGTLVYNQSDEVLNEMVIKDLSEINKLSYTLPEYEIRDGITYIMYESKAYRLNVFGQHNLSNIEAARIVCNKLGIDTYNFYEYISTFKGAARRLELLGSKGDVNVYKDFAHSPSKLRATIAAVKTQYPGRKLIACMELHTFSSLNADFLNEYSGSMDLADEAVVFIDLKTFQQKQMEPYPAETVKDAFKRDDLIFYNTPENIVKLFENIQPHNVTILMMSSGNFGGIDLNQLTQNILKKIF